jgi:predicted dinucleotide-binding enzyme
MSHPRYNEISSRKRGSIAASSFCDDVDAIAPVAALAKQLGFAPVKLGKLNEGGALVHTRGRIWGQLIFQDLFMKEQ